LLLIKKMLGVPYQFQIIITTCSGMISIWQHFFKANQLMNEISAKAAKNFISNLDYLYTSVVNLLSHLYMPCELRPHQKLIFSSSFVPQSSSRFFYRVCHGFRSKKRDDFFWGPFWPLFNRALFLEAAGAVLKIGSRIKPNRHREI